MGLFEKIFGPRGKDTSGQQWITLNNYTDASWKRWSGDAFESDLVRAAVDARARHISKLSPVLTGSAQSSLQKRLMMRPNSWQVWSQFLYRVSVVLDLQCTAFIVPVYSPTYDITGISLVVPSDFELVDVNGVPWLRLRFSNGNVASDELSHIGIMTRFQYLSDYFGTGNSALDATLELIDIQRQGIQEAAKNSATYRFMATLGNFAKPEDLAKERERFTTENLQKNAGGGLLLFPSTYKDIRELDHKQYSIDADQQKAIESRVFNYFGVNDKILSNSANADDLDAFYEGAVEPFALQLADVITNMLFSQREQSSGNRLQFSADRLAYMSTQNKIQLIQMASDRGELMQNEARRILNLPDLPDGNKTIIRGEYYVQQYGDDGQPVDLDEDMDDGYEEEDYGDNTDDLYLGDPDLDGSDEVDDESDEEDDDLGEGDAGNDVDDDAAGADDLDSDPEDEKADEEDFDDEDDEVVDMTDDFQEQLDSLIDDMKEILDRANDGEFDEDEEDGDDGTGTD